MGGDSPRVTMLPGEGEPQPPGRRHSGRRLRLAVAVGVLAGAGAVAAAVLLLPGSDPNEEESPSPPPAATAVPPPPKEVLRIVFPEGFTREEMAERIGEVNRIAKERRNIVPALSSDPYLAGTERATLPAEFGAEGGKTGSLEGFLFPATYEFTEDTTSKELVEMQLEAFKEAWSKIDLRYARRRNLTAYDVLIIASMIEEEVKVPRERPLVAAVIYNRLKARMPLGIDATLRYGLDIPPTEAIRQSHLDDPTPYNTRLHQGLPPTPVGNPGLASIQAAAHPAKVKYLFFVRKKDCKSHFFTATEARFQKFKNGPNSFLRGPNACS